MTYSSEVALSQGQIWWLAMRPRTLTMAVVPVIVGAVVAWHETHQFRLFPFLAALISALAIQIGTNLLNDAADGESGLDRGPRLGPVRVTAQGLVPAAQVKRAAYTAFAIAALLGLYCIHVGGLPILVIGVASLVAGWCYSRGPAPISMSATGEAFVLIFFGIVAVSGTAWLMNQTPSSAAIMAGIAVGLPSAAVLLVNNHRDRAADAIAGRRTLAIVIGIEATQLLYMAMLVVAALVGILLALMLSNPWMLLTLVALPFALRLTRAMMEGSIDSGLNTLLGRTASYQIYLAGLVCAGLVL